MTALSDALADFYERKGGRIFFQNGMSLNQLALEMWERLDYQGVDPSVISRVVNGKRTFTPHQLKIFTDILNLHSNKKRQLEEILLKDYVDRFGFELAEPRIETNNSQAKITNLLSNIIDIIQKMEVQGNYEAVQELTDIMIEISENIMKFQLPSFKQKQIEKNVGLLLCEKGFSISDTKMVKTIVRRIPPILKRVKSITTGLKDDDLTSRLLLLQAGTTRQKGELYPEKKAQEFHHLGKKFAEEGLKYAINPNIKFRLTKIVTGAAGPLKEKSYLGKECVGKISNLIEKYGRQYPEYASYLVCTLALSKANLGDKTAIRDIEKSWNIYENVVKKFNPLIEATLVRYTLESLYKLNNRDFSLVNKMKKRIDLISAFGFERQMSHAKKYANLLS